MAAGAAGAAGRIRAVAPFAPPSRRSRASCARANRPLHCFGNARPGPQPPSPTRTGSPRPPGRGCRRRCSTRGSERGRGRHPVSRIPYPVEAAVAMLAGVRHAILVGATPPVGFFAYPGKPSTLLPPDAQVHVLARPRRGSGGLCWLDLADALGAAALHPPSLMRPRLHLATGAISPESFSRSLAALLPEGAIVADESVTFGRTLYPSTTRGAAPHEWLQVMGGAIGGGMPMATPAPPCGAPGRRVVNPGGGRRRRCATLQALWTQSARAAGRHDGRVRQPQIRHPAAANWLPVGRQTRTQAALDIAGHRQPRPRFVVRLANAMGVEAARAGTHGRVQRPASPPPTAGPGRS